MNIIVTGLNGTVAPVIARYFEEKGHKIIKWDRNQVPTMAYEITKDFILSSKADFVFHIGMGPEQWASDMAHICAENDLGFLFTSTVDVINEKACGPYTVEDEPFANSEYGKYKIRCEQLINGANKNAYILRLGWQIGEEPGSNNMIDYLSRQMQHNGVIKASNQWYPSCSYLCEIGEVISDIISSNDPGLFLLNANENMSFFDIVTDLAKKHTDFVVEKKDNIIRDDRMIDNRVKFHNVFKR